MAKNRKIEVQGIGIVLYEDNKEDFISLTDIARYRDAERSDYLLQNWLRNRSTIEFIGLWETFNNPDFNSIEFDGIKNMTGSNSFSQGERLTQLNKVAIAQMKSLFESNAIKKLK